MRNPRLWATIFALAWLGAALHGAAPSNADNGYCTTNYNNNGLDSTTLCYYTNPDGTRYGTSTTCYSSSRSCYTKDF